VLRREFKRISAAVARLDRQVVTVLLAAALLVILQMRFGGRSVFTRNFADSFETPWAELLPWAWWFGMQGVLGFLVPVAILLGVFKRKWTAVGLGLGDWRLASKIMAAYVPLVIIGTWFLSSGDEFLANYPHYAPAARDWRLFFIYEAFFVAYWIGWEYLWRGFVLFGTAPRFGIYAIFIQAMPFAILHFNKPFSEALLSLVGGVALGALVWRCRSFWIAVPIHAAQMLILDAFCSLRIRSGVRGVDLDALKDVLGSLF
jgi:CAAX protease family protein